MTYNLLLQAPRVPVLAEDLEMKKLINMYGKTFHTWQVDRGDELPFGESLDRLPAWSSCILVFVLLPAVHIICVWLFDSQYHLTSEKTTCVDQGSLGQHL